VRQSRALVGFDGSGRDLEKSGDFTFGGKARWVSWYGQSGGDVRIHTGDSSIGTGPEVLRRLYTRIWA